MQAELKGEIHRRLAEAALDVEARALVEAACEGDAALGQALGGLPVQATGVPASTDQMPAGVTVRRVSVQGFRGIGAEASLHLPPGPGLILIVGRNGSGKSSFADGIEAALTGTCARWQTDASRDRRGGWANLHHTGDVRVELELVAAERGPVRWRRTWQRTDELGPGELETGLPPDQVAAWTQALETHRPMLATGELARLPDQRPTALFDTLARLLGLEPLTAAVGRLGTARLERERRWRATRRALPPLRRRLAALDDDRARTCKRALLGDRWDLATVDAVVAGRTRTAPRIDAGSVPGAQATGEIVETLRARTRELARLAGSSAERARVLASILTAALDRPTDAADCPVCETPGVLDAAWRERATERVDQARALAEAALEADQALHAASAEARAQLVRVPGWLSTPDPVLPADLVGRAAQAWSAWAQAPADPLALADHLEATHPPLLAALQALTDAADRARASADAAWLPIARDLAVWSARANQARAGLDARRALTRAESWLKDAAADLREVRFAPIAARSQAVWSALRQESHVELGELRLTGKATTNSRRVQLPANVDGTEAPALGVMSQGELNGLALSLFVPRATDLASPFRFVVIDDPIQAMDPHKVDGLARVLADVADTHQVIVFTHDARLLEAARRMGLACTVLEVLRRSGSQVEVRRALAPVERYLRDADALLAARAKLGQAVSVRLVAGACRHAIEAALTAEVRRVHLGRGEPHAQVESLLRDTHGLHPLAAIALLDDARAQRQVGDEVARRWGAASAQLLDDLNRLSHGTPPADSDPGPRLLRHTRRLVQRIADLARP